MTNRRNLLALRLALAVPLVGLNAWSCSPSPAGSRAYVLNYIAVVVLGDKPQDPMAVEKRLPIPVKLRVMQSEGSVPAVGDVLSVERRGSMGADCQGSEPLTLRDYYLGAKINVETNDLRFADRISYAD